MDEPDRPDPDPNILWRQIREAERTAPAERPVVLVVEDDPTVRMFMRHALRSVVRTDAAGTVADALRMAETLPYDGLLVDLQLPDGKGTEIVNELRERTPYWGVPMVAATAHSLPAGQGHYLDAGFDAYMAKPFDAEDLRTLVRHLVVEADPAVDTGRRLTRRDAPPTFGREDEAEDGTDGREAPATRRPDARPER
jgi:CheY-like chemotaxis protein